MKNFYFDVCSIPVYLLILWICCARKMTKGPANRIFILVNVLSLICSAADILMEFVVNPVPISSGAAALGTGISFTYKLLRNCTQPAYLIYIFVITKTEYRLRQTKWKLFLWLPLVLLMIILIQNFFTHNVFIVTEENGYSRGSMVASLYVISLFYWLVGTGYCVTCKKFFSLGKWVALLSVFLLTFFSVLTQLIFPKLMVEMFFTSIGMMMIMLMVMRPEETIDASVNIRSWKAYQEDLRNILNTGQDVQIVAIELANAVEIRSFIGEDEFNRYISEIGEELEKVCSNRRADADLYFERPATIYLLSRDKVIDAHALMREFEASASRRIQRYLDMGVRSNPRICVICCPEDLKDYRDIINLGHRFTQLAKSDEVFFKASELKKSRDYELICHMEEILNRAIVEKNTLKMHYQPIYDVKTGTFRSAEALARIYDSEYGMIPPSLFIPAAEYNGQILSLGDLILEEVFKYISELDIASLGLEYIEINLSVAQCLQRGLPDTVRELQKKYGINPKQVNFEITETMFGNLNSTMEKNIGELVQMGYTFSLDDYGTGYSNLQRLRNLPLKIIKIDKSLADDMFTRDGRAIIENTVNMMKSIDRELVIEGVETGEAAKACRELSCDFIQGFYYTKPLPEDQFEKFLRQHVGG